MLSETTLFVCKKVYSALYTLPVVHTSLVNLVFIKHCPSLYYTTQSTEILFISIVKVIYHILHPDVKGWPNFFFQPSINI
jgi:hypothetical protein